MAIFVAIDPALLAAPNHASSVDEAELIFKRIIYWAKPSLSRGLIRTITLSDAIEVLAAHNYFPSRPNVIALLALFDLQHVYSAEDISRSINFILERSLSAIDEWGFEADQCALNFSCPQISQFQHESSLFDASLRLLASSVAATAMQENHLPIVISGFPIAASEVDLRVTINRGSIRLAWWHLPMSIFGRAHLVENLSEIALLLGASNLWRHSTDASHLHFAIATKRLELLRASGSAKDLSDVPNFMIGSDFLSSVGAHNAVGSNGTHCELVLETCARIVLGQPKNSLDSFEKRNLAGRLVPFVRERDGANALRTHMMKHHEGLRLMLWRTVGGTIEFANVGTKFDLEISIGHHHLMTECSYDVDE